MNESGNNLKDFLPPYGLGAAHVLKNGEAAAVATIEAAYQRGIRFFDTAPLYALGRSEAALGRALAGVPRDSYLMATKVGRMIQDDGTGGFDFSRDGILKSLEGSLERLGMNRVDILHIHDPEDHYRQALDEAYPTVAELRSQGLVKAVGSGMNQWEMLDDFARTGGFDCFLLAGRYTLLEQTSLGFLERCRAKGIAVILGGVYNSGILVRDLEPGVRYNYRAAPPEMLERARAIAAVCRRHSVPLPAAALRFPTLHPAVTSIVVGAESPAEVEQNLELRDAVIPDALWQDLGSEGLVLSAKASGPV